MAHWCRSVTDRCTPSTQVSYACLAGVSVIVLLIPANRWLAVKIQKANDRMMLYKDARVKRMGDLLHGIRAIKTAAWEQVFAERVRDLHQILSSGP